jgi:hypothetical protein
MRDEIGARDLRYLKKRKGREVKAGGEFTHVPKSTSPIQSTGTSRDKRQFCYSHESLNDSGSQGETLSMLPSILPHHMVKKESHKPTNDVSIRTP